MLTLGFAMCGSFCTLDRALGQMEKLSRTCSILPIMSQNVYATDTRFGRAEDMIAAAERISGRRVIHTIVEAEPIGPKKLADVVCVCPCTGNSLSKIAGGITDTPVTMAVKSALRVGTPVVICLASNDSLAGSGQNLMRLMNTKNIYFVPLGQDDPENKPFSLVADFDRLAETVDAAVLGRQIEPVLL